MTKFMVRCDIEGVTGVVSYEQAEPGKSEYVFGHKMFMSDLLAVIDGLLAGGADKVVIYDEHYNGRNIDLSAIDCEQAGEPCVEMICGKPPYLADWAGGLDSSFDGVVLMGLHSKFGTPGGVLPHTYELDIRDLRLNGTSVGEIGLEAGVAGDWGVPVLLVTSDSAGVAEAKQLLPGVAGVVVKEAISETGALCYPSAVTQAAIRAAAQRVVELRPDVKPYRLGNPVTLEVELHDGPYCDAICQEYPSDIKLGNTLHLEGETVTAVWADYWQRKLHCQAIASREMG